VNVNTKVTINVTYAVTKTHEIENVDKKIFSAMKEINANLIGEGYNFNTRNRDMQFEMEIDK
jgi:uncharacterized protein YacL